MSQIAQAGMAASKVQKSFTKLVEGVQKFQTEVYPAHKDEYERLIRDGQKPHALFITCADSRIDPEALTQSGPGDIFVLRNIGNMVPSYGEMLGGVSSVIEYAVTALNVDHVVICGHTDCGAIKGLLNPEGTERMPTVRTWLRNGDAALSVARAKAPTDGSQSQLDQVIEENVLLQMRHLQTHPSVAGRLANGSLIVSGWVYDIAHGTVRIYNEAQRKFVSYETYIGS